MVLFPQVLERWGRPALAWPPLSQSSFKALEELGTAAGGLTREALLQETEGLFLQSSFLAYLLIIIYIPLPGE